MTNTTPPKSWSEKAMEIIVCSLPPSQIERNGKMLRSAIVLRRRIERALEKEFRRGRGEGK